ncbi:hypothetical protein ES332_A06G083200v1 [Gossypium tomentosum]|uniref:Uncharacterized protein n=1 Tax=Gossypium tomentosum TaxID=34277 RepID=A0A5D2Q3H9_GOSTO|nr:hypothetical protein ES332_A06G083200v1 [Gossypium tomentosum]
MMKNLSNSSHSTDFQHFLSIFLPFFNPFCFIISCSLSLVMSGRDIHAAARSGDLSKLQSILASNLLAVNSRDKHSRTPLHLAVWARQAQVVSYLCKQKADVGAAAMDGMGAIHFVAQKGHLEVV